VAIIEVQNLTKEFKRQKRTPGFSGAIKDLFRNDYEVKTAVNDVSFKVEKGEILGYIGPNGAGKSTTIKMMVGILVPTKGDVRVTGLTPYQNRIEIAKKMGVVFGQRTQLWWDIPVSESFKLSKYMYKIPEYQFNTNMELFKDILGISEFINIPVRQLSLGQRMRADLCMSLLHNPEILYLDEPTIGLDIIVKGKIREFIKEINKIRHTTVILTTHDLSDIEELCSRIMVIDTGEIKYDGNLQDLKNTYGTDETLVVELSEAESVMDRLNIPGVVSVNSDQGKIFVKYNKLEVNSTEIIKNIINSYSLKDFNVIETNIDEIIKKIYARQLSYDVDGVNVG
jgi:ABC-2 type transport system ATP-binding protein